MDIKLEITNYLNSVLKDRKAAIDPATLIISSGLLDSIAILDLVMYMEEQFEVTIDGDELTAENFETVDAIAKFVEPKIST